MTTTRDKTNAEQTDSTWITFVWMFSIHYTVEPSNNGHVGTRLYGEVVLSSEVKNVLV